MILRTGGPAVRRRLLALFAATFLLVAAVVAHLAATPDPAPGAGRPEPTAQLSPSPAPDATAKEEGAQPASLNAASDPDSFARLVTAALFEWDTTEGVGVADTVTRLVSVGDPTGEETPGLVADLGAYLPRPEAWALLRGYATRQWIDIDTVTVPTSWPDAVAQAPPGSLLPGTVAFTVRGVRHRSGVWEDRPVTSEHPVAFTLFVVCGPSYDACRLLRLSRLDDPLT